jgi:hypothetical protein
MQTHEIPSSDWGDFLNNLSRRHEGEDVTIEVQSADLGAQTASRGARLVGITFDPKDSIGEEIDVMVRCSDQSHLMHAIQHPSHVRIAQQDNGADAALQLEDDQGRTTLVRFLSQTAPDGPSGTKLQS